MRIMQRFEHAERHFGPLCSPTSIFIYLF